MAQEKQAKITRNNFGAVNLSQNLVFNILTPICKYIYPIDYAIENFRHFSS